MPTNNRPITAVHEKTAFLLLAGGGTARDALPTFARLEELDQARTPRHVAYVDTEPSHSPHADSHLHIGLSPDDVAAIVADPNIHGPIAKEIIRHYPHLLRDYSCLKNGSRTIRLLTQLSCEVKLFQIIDHLNKAIRHLLRQSGATSIQPICFSSSAGGCGSALAVIWAQLFADPDFADLITEGLTPRLIDTLICFVVEPTHIQIQRFINKK